MEAFRRKRVEIQTENVLLPNGRGVEITKGKIRQFLGAELSKEVEIRWHHKRKKTPEEKTGFHPGEEFPDGEIDYLEETKDYDPEKPDMPEIRERTKVEVQNLSGEATIQLDSGKSTEKKEDHYEYVDWSDPEKVLEAYGSKKKKVKEKEGREIFNDPDMAPSENLWEKCDSLEKEPFEKPASPRNKKRNQTRRETTGHTEKISRGSEEGGGTSDSSQKERRAKGTKETMS
jgi:hypothetical protein